MTPEPGVEVLAVELAPLQGGLIADRHVDLPRAGTTVAGHEVQLVGWVLGSDGPVGSVRLVCDERALAEVPVDMPRPDLAETFPDVPWAETAGYRCRVGLLGTTPAALELHAVVDGRAQVPLATVTARRTPVDEVLRSAAALVTVVITAGSGSEDELHAAIESALQQTYPGVEIVVCAREFSEGLARVHRGYENVRLLRVDGVAAGRNAALAASTGAFVVFLDARDRLLPAALETGLRRLAAHPDWAFVSGRTRITGDGGPHSLPQQPLITNDNYAAFLRGNYVVNHGTVMYRRLALAGGPTFDESLPQIGEYDLYLRLARGFPVGCHAEDVVEEGSRDGRRESAAAEVECELEILERQLDDVGDDARLLRALQLGVSDVRARRDLLVRRERTRDGDGLRGVVRSLTSHLGHGSQGALLEDLEPAPDAIRDPGQLDTAGLRPVPALRRNGHERIERVDRHYVEEFLGRNADDIRGRVLEAGGRELGRRLGGAAVIRYDVLGVRRHDPRATITGDLESSFTLPAAVFDCVILTDMLQGVFDVRAALSTVHRSLRPGGVLLLTASGLQPQDWSEPRYWAFTTLSLGRLLEEAFGPEHVAVESHGNVLAANAQLHGISREQLASEELDLVDPRYPMLLAARAVRSGWTVNGRAGGDA